MRQTYVRQKLIVIDLICLTTFYRALFGFILFPFVNFIIFCFLLLLFFFILFTLLFVIVSSYEVIFVCYCFLLWGCYCFWFIIIFIFIFCWVINSVWHHGLSLVLLNLVCSRPSCHPFTSSWSRSAWTIPSFPWSLVGESFLLWCHVFWQCLPSQKTLISMSSEFLGMSPNFVVSLS